MCHNISGDFDKYFNPKFNSKEDGYFTKSSFTGL
jgi:hypothetical protein